MNAAIANTWNDRLADLGHVPSSRILADPAPGTATLNDIIHVRNTQGKICELIDGTLVEKAMGWRESMLAAVLLHWLMDYLDKNPIGVAAGADGLTRLFGDTVRGPDVAFYSWQRLPNGQIPTEPIPDLVPDFVIEVLSQSNTYSEMSRQRREYFHAGVRLLWMVDPRQRTVAKYRSSLDAEVVPEEGILDGGEVLPSWMVDLKSLFGRLDLRDEG